MDSQGLFKRILTAVFFTSVLTAVYWNHFDNGFYFDDSHTIVNNAFIRDLSNIPSFFIDVERESSLPGNQAYRPVVTSLNTVDYWLGGGLNPTVFHWHIYLEFLLLLWLLYRFQVVLFRSVDGTNHALTALFGTALFAFHAATAETLNYIIARSDEFSTLMVMAGALIFAASSGWRKQLGLLPFIVGCLAKPTTLMLAPLLFLYVVLIERPSLTVAQEGATVGRKVVKAITQTFSFFAFGTAIYLLIRAMTVDTWVPGGNSTLHYLMTQPYVVWVYLHTFVLPTGLTADTDMGLIISASSPRFLWGVLVITIALVLAYFFSKRRSTLPIAYGILWFFIALVPTSSVIPLAEVMNHHRTFFPYIGLAVAVAWSGYLVLGALESRPGRWPWRSGAAVLAFALLAGHAWGTYTRNEVWGDKESLWKDVTEKSPNNGRGLMNYGLVLMAKGSIEDSMTYYERARKTEYGSHPYLFINMGIATSVLARRSGSQALSAEAEQYFLRAIDHGPGYPQTHYRYAAWLQQAGRSREALLYVDQALALAPANLDASRLKTRILESGRQNSERLQDRLRNARTPEAFLNLSLDFYELGMFEECIDSARKALGLRPGYAAAYNNICSAQNQLGQYALAIDACNKALELDPYFERARNNLEYATQREPSRQ